MTNLMGGTGGGGEMFTAVTYTIYYDEETDRQRGDTDRYPAGTFLGVTCYL